MLCISEDGKIYLYDSFYTSVSEETLIAISLTDPMTIAFHQVDLRPHYRQCLENGRATNFPVIKK